MQAFWGSNTVTLGK